MVQQLHSLPIPAGALVIDMRDADDGALAMLEGEIKNLAGEMNMQQVDHWRYLTAFIEFLHLPPLSSDEVKDLRGEEDKQQKQQTRSATGRYNRPSHRVSPGAYYEDEDLEPSFTDQIPNDQFKRNIEDCVRLIDAIRNSRFKAVGDMHKRGNIGPHAPNAKVQVILLVDEDKPTTLSSAAAYAAHLKGAYRGLEQFSQAVLDTTIICLNHDNQSNPPRLLINRLSWNWKRKTNQQDNSNNWEHIDALFLCEKYGHNAVRIPQHVQPYLAELLLYTLLITPPLKIRPEPPETSGLFLPPPNTQESQQLPVNTYLIGLNAIEYSGRWGRRYLNYSLVREIVQTLNDPQYDQLLATRNAANAWLRHWRIEVRKAVPDEVGGDIPALHAFNQSTNVAAASDGVSASYSLVPHTGDKHIQAFGRYVDAVAQTYVLTPEEEEEQWKKRPSSLRESTTSHSEQVSLETALTCVPAIVNQMHTWQPGDPEPPVVRAQQEAQRVLSHPDFFPRAQGSGRGAVPRAKQQLDELSRGIKDLQNEHKRNGVDLKRQREELIALRDDTTVELREHQKRFPLLAGLLRLKPLLAGLTLLLSCGLTIIALFILFAWFHQFLQTAPNLGSLVNGLDTGGIFGLSLYTLIIWLVIAIVLLRLLLSSRTILNTRNRSAVRVEGYFWAALITYPILGLIVSLSAGLRQNDPRGYGYLLWMENLPFWSNILLLIAITILLIEIIYYVIWHNALVNKLAVAVQKVKEHQEKTSDLVKNYVADAVALELLRRAELTDGNGGPGPYYRRIDQLQDRFEDAERYAKDLYELASQRLMPRGNDKQTSQVDKKPTLDIRTEILDVPKLTASSKRIRSTIGDQTGEVQEFAGLLLRVMGAEEPGQIEQHARGRLRSSDQLSLQQDREKQHAQTLLSVTAALALRVELDQQAVTGIAPLRERYHELGYRVTNTFTGLQLLFERLEEEAGREAPQKQANNGSTWVTTNTDDGSLIDYALLTWCQSLWEQNDDEVRKLLEAKTITEYLRREGYDPQTVKGMLGARTVITGRSIEARQVGELSFLMFPSRDGNRFFEDMGLEPRFVGIPDMERLILLYIHQYVAPPHFIVKVEPDDDQIG